MCGAVQVVAQLPWQVTIETRETIAPAKIIGFCGDTKSINHVQIWEIKSTHPQALSYGLVGNTYINTVEYNT